MQGYETCLVIHPETGEDDIATLLNRLGELIANDQGKILKTEKWGIKRLQYQIKNLQKGYYCILYYLGNSQMLSKMDRLLRFNESILRFQTIRIENPSRIKPEEQPIESAQATQVENSTEQTSDLQQTENSFDH